MNTKIFLVICLMAIMPGLYSQQQDTKTLHETARAFMQQGDYTNAIIVLGHALEKEPANLELLKDLAFTYYLQKNYPKALETAKPLPDRQDADVQSFQILGLVYKVLDDRKEVEKLYRQGLHKFPASGVLYNEYAEVVATRDGSEAIKWWEKGIEVDPNYSTNYYNACKYYYTKNQKPWSLLYGEIFVNLESYSRRTVEIKDVLDDAYKQVFASLEEEKKKYLNQPFTIAFLTTLGNQSSAIALGVTPSTLSLVRTRFILEWFDKYAAKFPFRLFDYHHQLITEGMFDAYNQWIFGSVEDLQVFQNWTASHSEEYNRFISFQKGRIFKLPEGQHYYQALTK